LVMHLPLGGIPLWVRHMNLSFIVSSDHDYHQIEGMVGWVTQLVVDVEVRRQRIATDLLKKLRTDESFANVTAMGLASSHPASCTALATCASKSLCHHHHHRVLLG
jgi:hypothetical protein